MSRILAKNVDFEEAPTVGGIQSDSNPLQLRGIPNLPILRLTELLKSNSPNHHFRWVAFWSGNVDFDGSPTVFGIQSDLRPLQLRGISDFPILRTYGTFYKNNPANHHFRRVAFLAKRRFLWIANGGGGWWWMGELSQIAARCNYDGFPLSRPHGFTGILKSNFPNRRFRRVAFGRNHRFE